MTRHRTRTPSATARALAGLAVAAALAAVTAGSAHATTHSPGRPDLVPGWLEGPELLGALVLPDTGRASLVTITDFRGDRVTARAWDMARGTWRDVVLGAGDLVGLHWFGAVCSGPGQGCAPITYRVASAARDTTRNTMPAHGSNRDVWLYQVEYTSAGRATWANACDGTPAADAPSGSATAAATGARGLFARGRWASDGAWSPGGYTLSCLDGVVAKCIRGWGYKPWLALESADHGRVSLLPLHLACVRAARADYCGDGLTHTRDGTFVDMFDRYGFNVPEYYDGHRPESAFDTTGALWVHAPRWPDGERDGDRWRFATCTRPASPDPRRHADPLVRVRSVTALGGNGPG